MEKASLVAKYFWKNEKLGHLREVGVIGFVDAVQKENCGVWIVLHLYESASNITTPIFLFSASFNKSLIYTILNSLLYSR